MRSEEIVLIVLIDSIAVSYDSVYDSRELEASLNSHVRFAAHSSQHRTQNSPDKIDSSCRNRHANLRVVRLVEVREERERYLELVDGVL